MDQLKKYFTGSSEKSANIKFDVNGLKDSSRADTTTSIGVLINNSPKRGVYIDVVDGQALLNVSVPVKERNLDLKVSGVFDNQTKSFDLLDYSFNHSDDDFPEHVVTLKVRGAKKIGEIMQNHTEEFLACVDKVEKKYEATSIKESSGCLELRFQHKSEQSARAMVADQKQIEGMFEEFVKCCGQEGDVSVQAEYEIVEKRELEAPAQRKDRTHSQSRRASSGRIITLSLEDEMNRGEVFKRDLKDEMDPDEFLITDLKGEMDPDEFLITDLKDEMDPDEFLITELEVPLNTKDRTDSQSQTTGSGAFTTESSSDSGIIAMEEVFDQRKDRTHSQSQTTWRTLREMFKDLDLEDQMHPSERGLQSHVRELQDPFQTPYITDSQSRTTGSDSGTTDSSSDSRITAMEEAFDQRKDRTHSQSQTTWRERVSLREMFKDLGGFTSRKTKNLVVDKITQWLSALRNSGGGKLHLKFPPPLMFDLDLFKESILENCLEKCMQDELEEDVFEITVNEKEHIIVVDAKPSHELITFKFNTKIKTVASLLNPTKVQMVALLQRRRKETPAQLKGIDWNIRPGKSVVFVSAELIEHPCIVEFLSEDKSLRECISAMSKNINGGSYFLGIDSCTEDGQTFCWISGFGLGSSARELSTVLSRKLKELIDENFLVFDHGSGQFKSPPPDLIQCEVHRHRSHEYVIEVAVRPFNGVVFYERHGPEAYKLDDKNELVRLTLDQWISEMTT